MGKGEDREEASRVRDGGGEGEGGGGQLSTMHLCGCDVIILPTLASILLLFHSLVGMQSHQRMAQGWRGLPRVRSIHV